MYKCALKGKIENTHWFFSKYYCYTCECVLQIFWQVEITSFLKIEGSKHFGAD